MCANDDPQAAYRNVLNQQAFEALAMLFVWRGEQLYATSTKLELSDVPAGSTRLRDVHFNLHV